MTKQEYKTITFLLKEKEKYQEVLGIKRLYNDKDTVKEILQGERS